MRSASENNGYLASSGGGNGGRPIAALKSDGAQEFDALSELYARVDEVLAEARPRCEMSGRCCDFPTSDHQLWATDLESAHALECAGGVVPDAPSGLCPWHVEGTCRLRDGRPLGCRLYFCDPSWADSMAAVYERFHAELKALHTGADIPYSYRPFVEAVRDPTLLPPRSTNPRSTNP